MSAIVRNGIFSNKFSIYGVWSRSRLACGSHKVWNYDAIRQLYDSGLTRAALWLKVDLQAGITDAGVRRAFLKSQVAQKRSAAPPGSWVD